MGKKKDVQELDDDKGKLEAAIDGIKAALEFTATKDQKPLKEALEALEVAFEFA